MNTFSATAKNIGSLKFLLALVVLSGLALGNMAFTTTGSGNVTSVPSRFYGVGSGLQWGGSSAQRLSSYPYSSQTQTICARFKVWRPSVNYLDNVVTTWNLVEDYPLCATRAPGGGAVTFPALRASPFASGIYTAQIVFTWQVNGKIVSQKTFDYSGQSDYACTVSNVDCVVTTRGGRGAIYIGPLSTLISY